MVIAEVKAVSNWRFRDDNYQLITAEPGVYVRVFDTALCPGCEPVNSDGRQDLPVTCFACKGKGVL